MAVATANRVETIDILEREEYQLERSLLAIEARNSLSSFTLATKPDYDFNWHHLQIMEVLEAVERGDIRYVIFSAPPQHGKTEIISIRFPAWYFGRNPDKNVAAISYADELAKRNNAQIQRVMTSPEYAAIFPEAHLMNKNVVTMTLPKRNSKTFDIVDHQGSYRCAGIDGQITGFGYDLILIDDPFKSMSEAVSKVIRDKVWEYYSGTLYTRRRPKCAICLINTRWHEDDLVGRILNSKTAKDWLVFNFPALCNHRKLYDPRVAGEPLWKGRYDLDELMNIKQTLFPSHWESEYQCSPTTPEGNMIHESMLPIMPVHKLPYPLWGAEKYFVADTAYTNKEQNDPHAVAMFKVYNNVAYIFDYLKFHERSVEAKQRLVQFMEMNDAKDAPLFIENKSSGVTYTDDLVAIDGINAIQYKHPNKDKVAVTESNLKYLQANRVVLVEGYWNAEYIEVVKQFPKGKHDEEVDLINMIIDICFKTQQSERRHTIV